MYRFISTLQRMENSRLQFVKEVNSRKIAKMQFIVQSFGQIYEYDMVMELNWL